LKINRFLSVFLIIGIVFSVFLSAPSFADEKTGTVNKDTTMYSAPGTGGTHSLRESVVVKSVSFGTVVTILDEENDADDDKWYLVRLPDTTQGYLFSGKVTVNINTYDADFETNLNNFPESYKSSIRALHKIYPNAKFVANKLDISFEEALNNEYSATSYKSTRKFVELTYGGEEWRDPRAKISSDKYDNAEGDGRWTYASKEAISYFLDPRNYLNSDRIFSFLQQSYSNTETKDVLKSVVKNTFLANGYGGNTDAYIDDIMNAAKETNVSSYVIAALIIIEQGKDGSSGIISGTYSEYEGLYNFFNIGASGDTKEDITTSGLEKAREKGWDTRYKSILGGAQFLSNDYISNGQDTYYYMDYNVVNKVWWKQYASSLYDAEIKGKKLKNGYAGNENSAIVFKIPVFTSIPDTVSPLPNPLNINPTPTYKKGDVNGDNVIDVIDAARIRKHILQIEAINLATNPGADVNGDGIVDVIDAAKVRKHILQIELL